MTDEILDVLMLVRWNVFALVDNIHAVEIEVIEPTPENADSKSVVIFVKVAPSDCGKLIGKEGRNIRAVRTILCAANAKLKRRYILQVDGDRT